MLFVKKNHELANAKFRVVLKGKGGVFDPFLLWGPQTLSAAIN